MCICRIIIYLYNILDKGRDSLIDFESFGSIFTYIKPMVGLSYVIGKLTFEEEFIIISLILFKIQNYFAEITGFPSMLPFVGTPTTPLIFAK